MGNDLGRMIEQGAYPSVGEEEGMCFVVANLKKKVKAQHIKAVTARLPNLTGLTITSSGLKLIPPELANAVTRCELRELNLAANAIKQLPRGLHAMFETLVTLDLNRNALRAVEDNVGLEKMTSLKRLSLEENRFAEVPTQIFFLTNLVSLYLGKNAIERVPADLDKLERLTQLKLDGNRLVEFPVDALIKLTHLEILDLSNNQLTDMTLSKPKGVKLEKLRAINLGHNNLKDIPNFIFKTTALTELHLDHNRITSVPKKFAKLTLLKLLLLNSNKISEVPLESWAEKFTELQTFDLKDNPLEVSVVEVITKYGSLPLLRPTLKAKLEEQAIQKRTLRTSSMSSDEDSVGSSGSRRRTSTASRSPLMSDLPRSPRTPTAPSPPPPAFLAPPQPKQSTGDISPRQKFRNKAIQQARLVPSIGPNDSPEYFAQLLESTDKEITVDEAMALRDKLMYQSYTWLDAFIAAKGFTNLLTLLERNAKQLQHLDNDANRLQYEFLHCYKILLRIKLKDVQGTTGFVDALAFVLLPNILPSIRKIATKLLIELARIKMVGRKKLLLALEKVRRHLVEKKGKKEDGGPPIRKRERFRLLINMIGRKEDQDSTEVWEEKSRSTAPKEAEGTASNASEEATAEKVTEEKSQNAENHSEADQTKAEEMTNCYEDDSNEDPKQIEARRALRINTMRLINTIFSVTSNISVRVAIRKCMIDLGISDKISWVENLTPPMPNEWQAEVDSFESFMEDDNEDLEYMLQRKQKKGKKGKRKKTPSFSKRTERASSLGPPELIPSGSPVDKLRQVRRLNSITNLNRLAAASKSSDIDPIDDSDNDQMDSDDDASSTDPTTGDTAFTENDDTYASDEEGDDNWEEEQVPFEDYLRIKIVTLGTSIQIPQIVGSKGHMIVPFDSSKTIGDVVMKIKSQYPDLETTKFDWGLLIQPNEANPDGLWPDENRHCGFYDLKGQVLAEYRLKPWILKIMCNATDVINTLTLTKMRFDPHRTCADAVALVRSRFPHVSAWEEYDWGLYWHKGSKSSSGSQKAIPSPDSPASPLKKSRRRTTITKKDKKKLEEEQKAREEMQKHEKKDTSAQEKEEGMWLVDTEKLAAYHGLYMSDDLLELKMKAMGMKVKILSQEAVDFMQFDPMQKIEDILRDIATRVLPDSEKRNYLNYGLYLQRANPDQESSWLQEDKKLNAYKFGPEDCLCYLVRKKPIMILVYNEKVSAQMAKNEKYATFSRSASRLFNKTQMPIYTHFPVDFMIPAVEVKATIAAKVNAKSEEYELYYRKAPEEVVILDEKMSLHGQQVEAYARLLFVKKGVFATIEELAGATGEKDEEGKPPGAHEGEAEVRSSEGPEEVADESFKNITFEDEAKTEVKAGTLSSLIDHLIETPIYEPEYTKAFLLTHHAFTTSRVVLDYLLKRYMTCSDEIEKANQAEAASTAPASPEKDDKKKDKKKHTESGSTLSQSPEEADGKGKAEKTQRRILYLLKVWVDEYFYDFYDEDQLLERLIEFLNQTMVKEGGASSALVLHQRILQSIEANTMGKSKEKQVSMEFAPLPRIPRSLEKPNWFIIDEVELARQLTIRTYELFSAIRLFEFFGQPWSKPSTQHLSPNLMAFIEYFNTISRAVSTALLQQRKIRERVKLLTRFIRTAEELRDLGNYHLLQAFIAGFSNSAVSRLQWTKARLPKTSLTALQEVEELMSMNSSFKNYRTRLSSSAPPAIPYIGVCLQDLTFIEDGNRNKVENLINFAKHRLVYGVISLLEKFQKIGYNLQRVEEIQAFLREPTQLDDKQLYSLSLKVEPRNAGRSDIQ